MIEKLYDKLLHNLSRHTNVTQPNSKYIIGDKFPDQISELINTEVTIKYRTHFIVDEDKDNINIHRPSDDIDIVTGHHNTGPEDYDPMIVYSDKFKVLRADKSDPYVLIAISNDGSKLLVNSTKPLSNGKLEYTEKISIYPKQINELIGLEFQDQFYAEIDEIRSCTLRVDNNEPCYSVLMEILGSTGYVRFVLGDEVQSKLSDYYDDKWDYDYNAKNAKQDGTPTDVDGYLADHSKISNIIDINGGPANKFNKLYTDIMSDTEVADFRKKILEDKTIYNGKNVV